MYSRMPELLEMNTRNKEFVDGKYVLERDMFVFQAVLSKFFVCLMLLSKLECIWMHRIYYV